MTVSRLWKRLGWGAALLTAYVGLPFLLIQTLGWGVVRAGNMKRRQLALTFDDGPDPLTTPPVLDALAKAGAKATFFVIAGNAEAHPDLIRRMQQEGHEIEAHAAKHRHAWLRSPWGSYRDPLEAVRRVEQVTGERVRFQRPPHGGYSLATWLGQRASGAMGAHWNVQGNDWEARLSPADVTARVSREVQPSSVIVLHDAGPGARNTVPALPTLLQDLTSRGYELVRLDELEAKPLTLRQLPQTLLHHFDALWDKLGGIHPAGGQADNLYRVGLSRFPLPDMQLKDGRVVRRGDWGAEFHVNNPLLVGIGLRRGIRESPQHFAALARDLQQPPLQDAQVVYCLSSLWGSLNLLGFESRDVPPTMRRRLRGWANVLRWVFGNPTNAAPTKLSVMSRQAFLERYGK